MLETARGLLVHIAFVISQIKGGGGVLHNVTQTGKELSISVMSHSPTEYGKFTCSSMIISLHMLRHSRHCGMFLVEKSLRLY